MAIDDESLADDVFADLASAAVPIPGVSTVVRRLAGGIRGEWRRNTSKALRAAEDASGLTREDFAEWLAEEPRAVPLYLKILWAAGTNGHDKTLKGMGAVLGQAAQATRRNDSEGFEDAELALRAMADLTERHFRVLAVLVRGIVRGEGDNANYSEFAPAHAAEQSGMPIATVHQCLLNLAAAGLAIQESVMGGSAYPVTELGRAVARAALEVAGD